MTTPILGAVFGAVWSLIGFRAATRYGARDFSSISQTRATNYEVLVEYNLIAEAQLVLAGTR